MNQENTVFSPLGTSYKFLKISNLACIFVAVATALAYGLAFLRGPDGISALVDWLDMADLLNLMIFSIAGLAFLFWVGRAVANARVLAGPSFRHGPVMAWLWWNIPVFNLVMPFLVLRNLSKVARDPQQWKQMPAWSNFWLFWSSSVMASLLQVVGLVLLQRADFSDGAVFDTASLFAAVSVCEAIRCFVFHHYLQFVTQALTAQQEQAQLSQVFA